MTHETIPLANDDPATMPHVQTPHRRTASQRLIGTLEPWALVLLTVLTAAFFAVYPDTRELFLSRANLQILVSNQVVVAVVALAALVPLVTNEWDLSVGAIAGLSSVSVAMAMSNGWGIPAAVLLGAAIGVGVGLLNAVIITRAGVNGVITTLGMSVIIDGLLNQMTGGLSVVTNIPVSVTDFGSGTLLGIPRTAFALAVVALLVYYLLQHTPTGRYLYALGSNPVGARLVGLRTKLLLGSTFVVAGVLAGLAGVLQVARSGGADPGVGAALTLPALAAAFLSAAAVRPGRYNVGGTLVAIFFLATINSGLSLAGAPPYVSSYVNGSALVIGVALAAFLGRKRAGRTT